MENPADAIHCSSNATMSSPSWKSVMPNCGLRHRTSSFFLERYALRSSGASGAGGRGSSVSTLWGAVAGPMPTPFSADTQMSLTVWPGRMPAIWNT